MLSLNVNLIWIFIERKVAGGLLVVFLITFTAAYEFSLETENSYSFECLFIMNWRICRKEVAGKDLQEIISSLERICGRHFFLSYITGSNKRFKDCVCYKKVVLKIMFLDFIHVQCCIWDKMMQLLVCYGYWLYSLFCLKIMD